MIYKDKEVEIVSKEEAFWRGIRDARKADIESSENNLVIFKAILELAENKLKELNKKEKKK